MTKKLVNAYTEHKTSDIYDPNGDPVLLSEFIERLQTIEAELLQSGWTNPEIFINIDLGDYCDGDLVIGLTGMRLETDKEELKRLKQEERDELREAKKAIARANKISKMKEVELAELARLKAKYEK